ncbi:MAG: peptide chain release factor N(5)-glutamine methyltransferase [Oscillospiraceae bacterium]|nr:peptide chain release factor N(5)-glutamine methyltransferase [Oscillospiraceae bacterium]
MVIHEIISRCIRLMRDNNSDNPIFESHIIIRHCLKMQAIDLVLQKNREITPVQEKKILSVAQRRASGEPLQYILGSQEFMGLEFKVTPDVLIPRADTEILVEYILEKYPGSKGMLALEIGTGSGCIPVSLAVYNKRAFFKAVDISEKALEVARFNAKKHNVSGHISFICSDIFSFNTSGRFDVIISNPPYIETDVIPALDKTVRDYEPIGALDGGPDGLMFYRQIIKKAPVLLNDLGMIVFEIGYNQAEAVASLMEEHFHHIEIIKDLSGNDRVAAGTLKAKNKF